MIKESGSQPPSQVGVSKDCWMQGSGGDCSTQWRRVCCAKNALRSRDKKKPLGSSHSPPPDARKKSRKAVEAPGFNCGNWVRGGESVIWRVSESGGLAKRPALDQRPPNSIIFARRVCGGRVFENCCQCLRLFDFFTVHCLFRVIAFGNRNKGPLFDLIGRTRSRAKKRENS